MKSHAFAQWMNTTLGQTLLNQERACVATAMARVFGTRHVEVGVGPHVSVTPRYPGWQQPLVMPGGAGQADAAGEQTVIARPEELPFHDDMMDSLVLHHTLDLAEDPHQSLREGARVVRSGGSSSLWDSIRSGCGGCDGCWGLVVARPGTVVSCRPRAFRTGSVFWIVAQHHRAMVFPSASIQLPASREVGLSGTRL